MALPVGQLVPTHTRKISSPRNTLTPRNSRGPSPRHPPTRARPPYPPSSHTLTHTPSLSHPNPSRHIQIAEGLAHVTLLVVQAPLPSAERVAAAVEVAMDMGKRGLGTVARECYYYVQVSCVCDDMREAWVGGWVGALLV